MNKKIGLFVAFYIVVLFLGVSSCKKFEGSQTVPSYIRIESIEVDPLTDYSVFGASTSKVTDAWVYVDDQLIGAYELPSTFPVLKKGPHKVAVYGGIKVDGRSSARDRYPFYQPVVYQNLNLVEDSTVNLHPVLRYYPIGDGTNVGWIEDFENANTLLPESDSAIGISRVSGGEAWQSVNSYWSGKVELPPDSLDFTIVTSEELNFHSSMEYGMYCMLEMDYNCNDTFFVGVKYYMDYQLNTMPLVKVTPTDKQHDQPQRWNKIYINIGPTINENSRCSYFQVYFTSNLNTIYDPEYHQISEPRYFYFDNLKLLYRPL